MVVGIGYAGLSIATLISWHRLVMVVDIILGKIVMIKNCKFSLQDDYIEKYPVEKERNLTAILDAKAAYSDADFIVITHLQTVIAVYCILIQLQLKRC